jgi:hypothetical protein
MKNDVNVRVLFAFLMVTDENGRIWIRVSDPFLRSTDPGSNSQKYGFGFFYHQTTIGRKIFVPAVLQLLYEFSSMKNDVNVQVLFAFFMVTDENGRIRIQVPDLFVRSTDPKIRIRRIHMFVALPDPDLDPLVRGTDSDPSIIKQ